MTFCCFEQRCSIKQTKLEEKEYSNEHISRKALSGTVRGFYLQTNKLAWHNFMAADRRHETLGSDKGQLLRAIIVVRVLALCSDSPSVFPQSDEESDSTCTCRGLH